jgi:hypothetical protein
MPIDCRPAECAAKEPGSNYQFDRPWSDDLVIGPDIPTAPAHSYAWHPSLAERRRDAIQRMRPAVRVAEAAYGRLVGSDRVAGLHQRGDR